MMLVATLAIICAMSTVTSLTLALQLRGAFRKLQRVRQMMVDNDGYVPDDLIDKPAGKTFERASRYWSKIVVRTIDSSDDKAVLRPKK